MKIANVLIFIFAISALPTASFAAAEDFRARCQQWAAEDGVAADEMQSYLASCMKDAAADQEEEAARPDSTMSEESMADRNPEETKDSQ